MSTPLDNWNKQVLVIEEAILTLSYEKADSEGTIKLLGQYEGLLEKQIVLCSFNSEIKESLGKRFITVQSIFFLKAQLSDNRLTNNKILLSKNEKTILDLISVLTKHKTAMQRNKEILMRHDIEERHIEIYLPSLIADAYDFLATSTWNCIDWKKIDDVKIIVLATVKSLVEAGDKVITFYKKQIEWLKEGKDLLPSLKEEERLEFDNKISTAYNNIVHAIEEIKVVFSPVYNSFQKNPNSVVDSLDERIKKWEIEWKRQFKGNNFTQESKKDYVEKNASQSIFTNVGAYGLAHKRKTHCIPTTDFFNEKMKLLKKSLSHSAPYKKASINLSK